ncbi:MAG: hypothetical protein C0602_03270 [Denitrovibrio sp.]|nr:MAG: hypothetical protein C0602_03270 [Denitrovibrio sp.]
MNNIRLVILIIVLVIVLLSLSLGIYSSKFNDLLVEANGFVLDLIMAFMVVYYFMSKDRKSFLKRRVQAMKKNLAARDPLVFKETLIDLNSLGFTALDLAGGDFRGCDFSELNVSGGSLRSASFDARTCFVGADLSECNLEDITGDFLVDILSQARSLRGATLKSDLRIKISNKNPRIFTR